MIRRMIRKRGHSSLFAFLCAVVIISFACNVLAAGELKAAASDTALQIKKFEIGSGPMGGAYYVSGNVIANVLQKKLGLEVPITASATEGSGENIALLDQNRIQAGTVSGNGLYTAWQGLKPYKKKHTNLRILMQVYPNPGVFFALASTKITKISELKGKRIGAGAGPTSWAPLTGPFLEAHGIDFKTDVKKVYANWEDICNQVSDGLLDASISSITAGMSLVPAVYALAMGKKVAYLEWDPKALETLPAKFPYFNKMTVSARSLPGRTGDYATVDVGSQLLVVREDMPEDLAYKVVKTLHQNLRDLVGSAEFFKYISDHPKFMTLKLGDVQFHPGAVRYWKEAGLWQN